MDGMMQPYDDLGRIVPDPWLLQQAEALLPKEAAVVGLPGGDPLSAAGLQMAGVAPPGGDPAAAGGAPPPPGGGMPAPPPGDPAAMMGGGMPGAMPGAGAPPDPAMVQQAMQLLQSMGMTVAPPGGGAAGGAGGKGGGKNAEAAAMRADLWLVKYMLAMICQQMGLQLPPNIAVGPPPDPMTLQQAGGDGALSMATGQQPMTPGSTPGMTPPVPEAAPKTAGVDDILDEIASYETPVAG